jgi:transposase
LERVASREIANLQSKRDKTKDTKIKSSLTHRIDLLWRRLKRKRRGLHKELANLYGHVFTHVLRPDFRVSHLTRKYRRLSARISRRMRSLSLYSFKCELKRVSKNMGLIVITVDESYTSKICGRCGFYHKNLGGSKVFRCPNKECGHVAERDGSAARKILLLFIFVNTDQGYLMSSNGVSDASKSTVSKSCGCTSSSNLSSCIRIYDDDDDDEQKKMNSEKDITQQRSLPGCRFVKRVKV